MAMRLISWNCNMAFRNKYEYLEKFNGDLLLIQECENKEKLCEQLPNLVYDQFFWFGENQNKGVGLISCQNYSITINPRYNPEFQYVIPFQTVISNRKINLFLIWAMPHKTKSKSYVGQIWNAIHYYESELQEESILIGDFNSHVMWDKERRPGNHSGVIKFLAERDIYSLYHIVNNIDAGNEKDATWFMHKNETKPYHLDYCFASQSLIQNCKMTVGAYTDWIAVSDHMPLCVDLMI